MAVVGLLVCFPVLFPVALALEPHSLPHPRNSLAKGSILAAVMKRLFSLPSRSVPRWADKPQAAISPLGPEEAPLDTASWRLDHRCPYTCTTRSWSMRSWLERSWLARSWSACSWLARSWSSRSWSACPWSACSWHRYGGGVCEGHKANFRQIVDFQQGRWLTSGAGRECIA